MSNETKDANTDQDKVKLVMKEAEEYYAIAKECRDNKWKRNHTEQVNYQHNRHNIHLISFLFFKIDVHNGQKMDQKVEGLCRLRFHKEKEPQELSLQHY